MNLGILGSRSFYNNPEAKQTAKIIMKHFLMEDSSVVITGGAIGPSRWAEEVAKELKLQTIIYKPACKIYGKSAGLRRDEDIINKSDIVLMFWDEKSRETIYNIKLARKVGKSYALFIWKNNEWRKIESTTS